MMLQDHLEAMRRHEAPVPLNTMDAVEQAARLRRRGLTYSTIATVVATYHGVYMSERWWRSTLRAYGVPPRAYASGKPRTTPRMRGEM